MVLGSRDGAEKERVCDRLDFVCMCVKVLYKLKYARISVGAGTE